jgi:hypothetical protein
VTLGASGLLVGSGSSQFPIYPEAATRFFAKVTDIQLDFAPGSGPSASVVLRQNGKTFVYKRVP